MSFMVPEISPRCGSERGRDSYLGRWPRLLHRAPLALRLDTSER
jgi:hypothetical protein